MELIQYIVLIFMLLSGYGFWFYQLLRFIDWIAKKLNWLKSEAE